MIFHGFYIVVGGLFDGFDGDCIGAAVRSGKSFERLQDRLRQRRQLRQGGHPGEMQDPAGLDL